MGECEELFLRAGFMVKYPQMKFAASVLVALLVHASAFAGASVRLPSLTRDSWLYFGYCVVLLMCAAGLVFLARVNYATLRRLPLSLLVAFSLLAVCTSLDAEKTNRLAGVFCRACRDLRLHGQDAFVGQRRFAHCRDGAGIRLRHGEPRSRHVV